ncbi:MAG: dipicolinate synthase subunit B [Lachnospiraceae bacterium]|nr:dipicolinate synthase subunit B [Lachnospiraceae bacterium]
MKLCGKTIGFAMTGSFCTYEKAFLQMKILREMGATIIPIFSYVPQEIECRFGSYKHFLEKAEEISDHRPILTIAQAEPIGPKGLLDVLLIAPCTGNTMAKLSMAITDTPVLMAAKSQLRTERPVVLSLASNDSLGLNFKNLGSLYSVKHVYFVPFGQDDSIKKPNSLVAHMDCIPTTLEMALEEKQLQPVLRPYSLPS